MYNKTLSTDNKSATTFEDIINYILSQDNVMLSVKSSWAVCEVNTEMNIPLHVSDQYAIIGDETGPWHIHITFSKPRKKGS
jgi:hypothetical protein